MNQGEFECDWCRRIGFGAEMHICGANRLCPGCATTYTYDARMGRLTDNLKRVGGPVVAPEHYNACGEKCEDGTVVHEPIKVIESWSMNWGFCFGNALKYILRAPHKGSERVDLEKALWYLERLRDSRTIDEKLRRHDFHDAYAVAEAWGLEGSLAVAVHQISLGNAEAAANFVAMHLEKMEKEES